MMLTWTSFGPFTSWAGFELLQIVGEVRLGFLLVHRRLVLGQRSIDNPAAPRQSRIRHEFRFPARLASPAEDLIIASRGPLQACAICAITFGLAQFRGLPRRIQIPLGIADYREW